MLAMDQDDDIPIVPLVGVHLSGPLSSSDVIPIVPLVGARLSGPLSSSRFPRISELGRGAFGVAHLVSDIHGVLGAPPQYALKIIDLSTLTLKMRVSAQAEVAVLERLQHPSIVAYYGSWLEEGRLYIVLEYCNAGDLQNAVAEAREAKTPFSEAQIMSWFVQLASALFCESNQVRSASPSAKREPDDETRAQARSASRGV